MSYVILAETELEAEQLLDMIWATKVLAGYRDEDVTAAVAKEMLAVLATNGCTSSIRTDAGAALRSD